MFRTLVERRIKEAQSAGKFRDLEGEGAPQTFEDQPFEDPEMRVAYKVLRNSGHVLPWMQLIKDIDAELIKAEQAWQDYRFHRRRQMDSVHRSAVVRFAEIVHEIDRDRERALTRLEKRWTEINKMIARLNTEVPSDALKRLPISTERQRSAFNLEFPPLSGVMSAER